MAELPWKADWLLSTCSGSCLLSTATQKTGHFGRSFTLSSAPKLLHEFGKGKVRQAGLTASQYVEVLKIYPH